MNFDLVQEQEVTATESQDSPEQPATSPEPVTIDVAFSGATTAAEIRTKAQTLCAGKPAEELAGIASDAWNVCGTTSRSLTEQANRNRLIVGSVLLCIKDQCQHGEFEKTIAPVLEKLGCSRGTIWKLMRYASIFCVDKYIAYGYEKVLQAYKLAQNRFPDSADPIADLLQMVGVQDLDDVDVFGKDLQAKLKAVELVAECAQTDLTLDDALRLVRAGHGDKVAALKDTLTNNMAAGKSAIDVVNGILGHDIPLKKQAKPKKPKSAAGFIGSLKTFLKALSDENQKPQPTVIDQQTASELKQGIDIFLSRQQTSSASAATTTATLPDTPSAASEVPATPPAASSSSLPEVPTTVAPPPAASSEVPTTDATPAVIPATPEEPTPSTPEAERPATPQQ